MLLINADMGVIDASKVDKIDNTESLTQLDDISDVTLVNSTTGEVLRYDGAQWVNAQLSYSDLSNTPALASSTDDLTSDHTGVNYTGALNASLTAHLSGIDTALASAGGGASSTDDLTSDHTGVNYTGALNASLTTHLSGIDSELNNRADTVNSVAVVNGAVTIDSGDIIAPRTGVNYTAANTDTITTHLAGIDTALAGAGADSTDDLTSDHTGVNYTGALNANLTTHLSGIDSELNNRADTVNSVAVVNGAVTVDSGDIIAWHTGVNYTAANTDTITTHLAGIDTLPERWRASNPNIYVTTSTSYTVPASDASGIDCVVCMHQTVQHSQSRCLIF